MSHPSPSTGILKTSFIKGVLLAVALLSDVAILNAQDKPRRPYQLYEEAEERFADGQFTEALALLDECLKANPGYMEAYPLRAGAREQLNDLEGALTDYSIYLEKDPSNPDVLMSRAVVRYKIGFLEQAREDFRQLLRLQSTETTSVFYKQNMSLNDRAPIMTTTSSGHSAYVYNYLGLIEYKLGNPSRAVELFDSAMRLDSKEPDFYVNRGLAREALNDSTAVVDYEIALRLNPEHTLARHNLEAFEAKKLSAMTPEDRLTRTIEADSTMLYPYLERAQQRFEGGYFEGALDDYNQAVSMAPGDHEIVFARGLTKEKLKDYKGAFSDYTRAIELKEDFIKAWLSRGNVLLKLDRYEDAIEDYNVSLVYNPDYALAYYNRGMAKVKLKKNAEACADLLKAESMGMKLEEKLRSKICK